LGDSLVEGSPLVEDPAWLQGLALQEAVQPLGPAADVD